MDEKKFQELMENEEFVAELLSKEEPEDVQKLFADNGVEMSIDEIKWMGKLLAKVIDGNIDPEKILSFAKGEITEDELSDDELKEVSGGVVGAAVASAASIMAGVAEQGITSAAKTAVAAATSTGIGAPIAVGVIAVATVVGGITISRGWGRIGRGVSSAARSVGRALTSRW